MPYTMTHLIIADNLSTIFSKHIKNLPQFYLGNIAPDAVHYRENYTYEYKRDSHLYAGDEPWDLITNMDGWINDIINFLNSHKNFENCDFILGYCCHLLTDIYQRIALWLPFRQKYADEIEKGLGEIMRQETSMIDIELALTHERKDIFWSNIKQSAGVDLPGIVYTTEIEKQKDNILNLWYADKERQDLTSNKIVTVEKIMSFISDVVDFIVPALQEHFNYFHD